jgi:hypothetical protein
LQGNGASFKKVAHYYNGAGQYHHRQSQPGNYSTRPFGKAINALG